MPVFCCVLGEELSSPVGSTEAFGRNASGGTQHGLGAWVWLFPLFTWLPVVCAEPTPIPCYRPCFLVWAAQPLPGQDRENPELCQSSPRAQVCTWYLMVPFGICSFFVWLGKGVLFWFWEWGFFTFCCPFRGQIVLKSLCRSLAILGGDTSYFFHKQRK